MSKRRRTRTLVKAAPQPRVAPAATFTAEQALALMGAYTQTIAPINPLPRQPQVPFGPGSPIIPAPINPPRDDGSGRPEPRIYEYPVTANLPGVGDKLVPWKVLRDAAEIPVVRDCIRIRKNQIATLEWDIVVSKRALQQYRKQDPDTSSVTIQKELRDRLDPDVGRLVEFWQHPDWQQGQTFVEWATMALEEHLVLDALCAYPFTDRGKNRPGLRLLDGSTIKILRDGNGGRPMPPAPAFQQILWGFPRGEFIADIADDGQIPNGYTADRLIYCRRETRTWSPYGYSAVEQALQDVDLYLKRLEWQKSQYSEGVAPAGWFKNAGLESWSPQQLIDYSRAFNDLYSGQTLERMRYHMLPPGIEPMATGNDVAEKYKPDYDLHLIKLVAMHFDVTIAELGFTEAKGLGSSGYHEGQAEVAKRTATNPTLSWLQSVLTGISRTHLGMPPELEFKFLGLDTEEEDSEDEVIDRQLRSGRITLNECREEQGRAPYEFDEADKCMVETGRGLVFLEGASAFTPPGESIGPPKPFVEPAGTEQALIDASSNGAVSNGKPSAAQPSQPSPAAPPVDAKKAELTAYRKWLRNDASTGRPFTLRHLTEDDAAACGVDLGKVVFAAPGDLTKYHPDQPRDHRGRFGSGLGPFLREIRQYGLHDVHGGTPVTPETLLASPEIQTMVREGVVTTEELDEHLSWITELLNHGEHPAPSLSEVSSANG